ncbi:MAG: sigma-70 family RNA polymerase sigma factor [Clostridiales bacterium]|nr:sigma-70 family RNA polymerase sigma factor [Clostridiales bacterium]
MDSFEKYVLSLPEALGEEEQRQLLEKFYATRDAGIREKLITHNLRLAARCVSKVNRYGLKDNDDLMQIATVELVNVIDNKYDVTKGSFGTYAYSCMKGVLKCQFFMKDRSSDAVYQPQVTTIINKDDEETDVFDTVAESDDFRDEVLERQKLDSLLATLSDEDRYIIEHRLGVLGYSKQTFKEIASALGKNEQSVKLRSEKLFDDLRTNYLESMGLERSVDPRTQKVIEYINTTDNLRHKQILERIYGLNGHKKMKLKEIAEELDISINTINGHLRNIRKVFDINSIETVDVEKARKFLLNSTNPKEVRVCQMYFGLDGYEKMTATQIAKELGISVNNSSRIIAAFKKKLEKLDLHDVHNALELIDMSDIIAYYNTLKNERSKLFIEYRFGLNGKKRLTLKEIAKEMNIELHNVYRTNERLNKHLQEFVSSREAN